MDTTQSEEEESSSSDECDGFGTGRALVDDKDKTAGPTFDPTAISKNLCRGCRKKKRAKDN